MAKISFNAQMGVRFRKITADYGKINTYIHETAMMIVRHAHEFNDCSTAQGLVNAMPQSARKLALINWFSKFTPIVVKDDDKWESKMHKEGTKLYVPFDLEAAEATPWHTLAEKMGGEKKPMSLEALIKLVAGLSGRIEKSIEKGEVVNEDVPSLQAAALLLSGLKIERIAIPANDEEVAIEVAPLAAVA